jgi:tRNA(His) 5'-end guanylyltransferase
MHGFEKPNDVRGLSLMDGAAVVRSIIHTVGAVHVFTLS